LIHDVIADIEFSGHLLRFQCRPPIRELKKRGYASSYTVLKEAVRPLRETFRQMEAATTR
jgi:hypothetical protein